MTNHAAAQAAIRHYPGALRAVYPEPAATRHKRAWKLAYGLAREWDHRYEGAPAVLVEAVTRAHLERITPKENP